MKMLTVATDFEQAVNTTTIDMLRTQKAENPAFYFEAFDKLSAWNKDRLYSLVGVEKWSEIMCLFEQFGGANPENIWMIKDLVSRTYDN